VQAIVTYLEGALSLDRRLCPLNKYTDAWAGYYYYYSSKHICEEWLVLYNINKSGHYNQLSGNIPYVTLSFLIVTKYCPRCQLQHTARDASFVLMK
jgi:hypothetical protein